MSLSRISKIFQLLKEGVDKGVFPSAVCGVSQAGRRYIVACGYLSLTPFVEPVEDYHVYDLASLTKPLAGALILIDKLTEGKPVELFSSVKPYLPLDVPFFRLLNHTAGFKPWLPLYKHKPLTLEKAVELIIKEELTYEPGASSAYSDLGYFLLTYLLERMFGKDFENLFEEARSKVSFSRRARLMFKPLEKGVDVEDIAPTSYSEEEKVLLRGVVEDENTRALSGVSAVAGLFGNIYGVLDLLEALLLSYKGSGPFSQVVVRTFVEFEDKASDFALGFMKVAKNGKSAFGDRFSRKAFGHLGFTGTSFVVDPEKELIVALLTNRVHPDRNNLAIKEFRPVFHNLIAELFCTK
jgi:CubicO group peptidase (beta-lactamase class C family)